MKGMRRRPKADTAGRRYPFCHHDRRDFFGRRTHSPALFADGRHMGTHAFALGLSLFAYASARKYAADDRFIFGAWKIEILGA